MKRLCAWVLALTLLAGLCACAKQKEKPRQIVQFYYLRSEISYSGDTGVLAPESRELPEGWETADLQVLLRQYFTGPDNPTLVSPIPEGVSLKEAQQQGSILILTMSQEFGKLTGVDLSLACACLAKTCLEITGAESIHISAENSLLDGSNWVRLDAADLVLLDDSADQIRHGQIKNPIDE